MLVFVNLTFRWIGVVATLCMVLLGAVGCASSRGAVGGGSEKIDSIEVYDPKANGEGELERALKAARWRRKLVLLNLGANWCSDSHAMDRLLRTNAPIRRELRRHFIHVKIDVNQRGETARNSKIVARFDDPLRRGIPVLLILSASGELLNKDPYERLADDDHEHPAVVLNYLRSWATAGAMAR